MVNQGVRKISLCCCLIFHLFSLHAQVAPAIEWQGCLGGSDEDVAHSIIQTLDGRYTVAGVAKSSDGNITTNHGEEDCWIVKLNPDGSIYWQKTFGGSKFDAATSIQQLSDSGLIVVGRTQSNDGDVSGNHGSDDYWILRLDAAGNLLWQKCFGGSNPDYAYSIKQTFDHGFIVAGKSKSNDGDVIGNHGNEDVWMVKLDSLGNIEWDKCFGGNNDDEAFCTRQTSDSGYVVVGLTDSNDGDVSGNHGQEDYWIIKLDAWGNLQWQKCMGGSGNENAKIVEQVSGAGYLIGGLSNSTDGDVSGNHGDYDFWLVKTDDSANIEWQRSFGGSDADYLRTTFISNENEILMAGYTRSDDGDLSANYGSGDWWVVQTDSSGNIEWQKNMGGSGDDDAKSIQITKEGKIIVAGGSYSDDDDVSGNHGSSDYWVTQLMCNQILYADADGDSYGDPNNAAFVCTSISGFVTDNSDCDDSDPAINPDALEIPGNGIDDNCNGEIDEFGAGVSSFTDDISSLSIFPNPTDGTFISYLKLSDKVNADAALEIINRLGQKVFSQKVQVLNGSLQKEIQLRDATDGMYLVKVIVGDRIVFSQIILQK